MSDDKTPAFAIPTKGRTWVGVEHGHHSTLLAEYRRYAKLPPTHEGRLVDYIAWGTTVICFKCGPICPLCGRRAELAIVAGLRAGWVHAEPKGA